MNKYVKIGLWSAAALAAGAGIYFGVKTISDQKKEIERLQSLAPKPRPVVMGANITQPVTTPGA